MTSRTAPPAEFLSSRNCASEPQLAYVADLLRTREAPETWVAKASGMLRDGMTGKQASAIIDAFKPLPRKRQQQAQPAQAPRATDPVLEYVDVATDKGTRRVGRLVMPDGTRVLAGSYGVLTPEDQFTNDTSFFKLWIQKEGEDYGKGWSLQLYTSDDTHRVKLAVPTQLAMIAKIGQDPLGASALFGHEFKRCGVCGRGLTKDESRARGIGPVCAGNLGL